MSAPLLALFLSAVAVLGSLTLSLGLGLKACPLCFYQRTFAFSLVAMLLLGLLLLRDRLPTLSILALPLAVGGFGVAVFHTYLVASGKLECPRGILGLGSAPAQSLAIFSLIVLVLLGDLFRRTGTSEVNWLMVVLAILLGLASVYGSIIANPPPMRKTAADEKLETCKQPYLPPANEPAQ